MKSEMSLTLGLHAWGRVGNDVVFGEEGEDISGDVWLLGGNLGKVDTENPLYAALQANRPFWQPNYIDVSPNGTGDVIYAGNGMDFVWGGAGSDVIFGEGDADRLVGDEDGDIILGGAGNDVIWGDGNDTIYGGGGEDVLIGGTGINTLYGGAGRDTYVFEKGSQNTVYDTGDNTYRFGAGVEAASVKLKVGSLRLEFGDGEGGEVHLMNVDHNDLYSSLGGTEFEFADGSVLNSSELLARGFDIEGTDGDDIITGTNAPDRINGRKGNDTLIGGAGVDTYLYQRGDGADIIVDSAEWRWDAERSAWQCEGNVLSLGADIGAGDITAMLDRASGRIVLDLGDGDRIDIGPPHERTIQTMKFAEGEMLANGGHTAQYRQTGKGAARRARIPTGADRTIRILILRMEEAMMRNEERYMGDPFDSCARPTNCRVASADFLAANESIEWKVA